MKVTVSSSIIVNQIVANAKKLRQVENFRTVFVCPDRSLEQQQNQRNLVNKMNETALAEPKMQFFIKGGEIRFIANTVKIELMNC